jgi:hypothetical protein
MLHTLRIIGEDSVHLIPWIKQNYYTTSREWSKVCSTKYEAGARVHYCELYIPHMIGGYSHCVPYNLRSGTTSSHLNTGDCEDSCPMICLPDSSVIVVISTLVCKPQFIRLLPDSHTRPLYFYLQRSSSEHSSTGHHFSPPICSMYFYSLQIKMGLKKRSGNYSLHVIGRGTGYTGNGCGILSTWRHEGGVEYKRKANMNRRINYKVPHTSQING